MPPTPEHGAQFFIDVHQTLEITIKAEATQALTTELLFSGPVGVVKNSSGSGYFTMRWTPSEDDNKESHPICFVVQANVSSSVYQSELRCVIVTVGIKPTPTPSHVTVLKMKISTTMSLEDNCDKVTEAGSPKSVGVVLQRNTKSKHTGHSNQAVSPGAGPGTLTDGGREPVGDGGIKPDPVTITWTLAAPCFPPPALLAHSPSPLAEERQLMALS
ncbi:uncharacterized protein LOC119792406 [Cyprinodon tularosa]|uniref:uncharacterized protein LOC119792406 n=1 Tax=Cyprinodon tularosa TaxID=77115 RepID=UPI0018E23CC1|nr:uncharacterized protein LOC119792406 [Cyprinodon tularosa]